MLTLYIILGIMLYVFIGTTINKFVNIKFGWDVVDCFFFGMAFPITIPMTAPIYFGKILGEKLSTIKIEKKG